MVLAEGELAVRNIVAKYLWVSVMKLDGLKFLTVIGATHVHADWVQPRKTTREVYYSFGLSVDDVGHDALNPLERDGASRTSDKGEELSAEGLKQHEMQL